MIATGLPPCGFEFPEPVSRQRVVSGMRAEDLDAEVSRAGDPATGRESALERGRIGLVNALPKPVGWRRLERPQLVSAGNGARPVFKAGEPATGREVIRAPKEIQHMAFP